MPKREAVSTYVQGISKRRTEQSSDNQQQRETNWRSNSAAKNVLQGRVIGDVGFVTGVDAEEELEITFDGVGSRYVQKVVTRAHRPSCPEKALPMDNLKWRDFNGLGIVDDCPQWNLLWTAISGR